MSVARFKEALLKDISQLHLSDEQLAEIAAFEVDGGDVERCFHTEMIHIEDCITCAENYGALMDFSLSMTTEMDAVAERMSTRIFFLNLVQVEVAKLLGDRVMHMPAFTDTLHHFISQIPAQFTDFPSQSYLLAKLEKIFNSLENINKLPANIFHALQQVLWRQQASLRQYLLETAEKIWTQPLEFFVLDRENSYGVQPEAILVPLPAIADVSSSYMVYPTKPLERKQLLTAPLAGRHPADIVVNAHSFDKLACTVEIEGIPALFYRTELKYAGNTHNGHIANKDKIVFSPIPVAALPELQIELFPK